MSECMLLKTITEWKEEAKKNKMHLIHEEKYGGANYFMGKEQAYKDIEELLLILKEQGIPFNLM